MPTIAAISLRMASAAVPSLIAASAVDSSRTLSESTVTAFHLVGIYLGLMIMPEAAGAAWAPLFSLTMLANTFVSPSQMPGWLGVVSEWNPLSATVASCRELFGNPGLGGDSWAAQHSLLLAIAWPVLIVAAFLPLSVRRYRRLDR